MPPVIRPGRGRTGPPAAGLQGLPGRAGSALPPYPSGDRVVPAQTPIMPKLAAASGRPLPIRSLTGVSPVFGRAQEAQGDQGRQV